MRTPRGRAARRPGPTASGHGYTRAVRLAPVISLALALLGLACDAMPAIVCDDRSDGREVDVNGDGRPDLRIAQVDGRELCREVDLNFDGQPDLVRVSVDGSTIWSASDFDFDGHADQVEIHVGEDVHTVIDLDGDGRPDLRQVHREGRVIEQQGLGR